MSVAKLMSERVVTVEPDTSLKTIKELFEQVSFHHLLVEESGMLCGVISDRDLLKSLNPKVDSIAATEKDLACLNKKAHQIMSRQVIYVHVTDDIQKAIQLFNHNDISCIPVVDDDKKPVGILSWRDIIAALEKRKHHH